MKSALRLTGFVLASVALLLGGCGKKPQRPNPSQTVFGSGAGSGINPTDLGLSADLDSTLTGRDTMAGPDNQIRGVLPIVYFDFDSAAVRVAERAKVTQAAEYLNANPGTRVLLEGHCDWRGTSEYNMGLGDRRAKAVKDYLATLGISGDRLDILSLGDTAAKEGGTEAEMQNDRRVEIVVLR